MFTPLFSIDILILSWKADKNSLNVNCMVYSWPIAVWAYETFMTVHRRHLIFCLSFRKDTGACKVRSFILIISFSNRSPIDQILFLPINLSSLSVSSLAWRVACCVGESYFCFMMKMISGYDKIDRTGIKKKSLQLVLSMHSHTITLFLCWTIENVEKKHCNYEWDWKVTHGCISKKIILEINGNCSCSFCVVTKR